MRSHIAMLAAALVSWSVTAAAATDDEDLWAEAHELRQRVDALETQREMILQREVERYLGEVAPEASAEGGDGLRGVTLDASLTGVFLATVGSDPADTHSLHGEAELDFDFEITDNLVLFLDLTANSNAAAFPSAFGPIAGPGGATVSGLTDGIGVDGTVSTAPGDISTEEWGFLWTLFVGG